MFNAGSLFFTCFFVCQPQSWPQSCDVLVVVWYSAGDWHSVHTGVVLLLPKVQGEPDTGRLDYIFLNFYKVL
jgi:hypothetical protein